MQAAADAFYKSLNEIYDDAWMGKDMISSLAKVKIVEIKNRLRNCKSYLLFSDNIRRQCH